MQFQDYLKEFLRVLVKMIRNQVEDRNILPCPQVAFLVNGDVYCESIDINDDKARDLEAQRIALYWRKKNPEAAIYINSGKIGQKGDYEFLDQYRTDSDFDNHKGDLTVQLAPLVPRLQNVSCMLLVFKETIYGLEFQETRSGFKVDDVTKALEERMKKLMQ